MVNIWKKHDIGLASYSSNLSTVSSIYMRLGGPEIRLRYKGPRFFFSLPTSKLYLGLGLGETTSPVICHSVRAHFLLQAVRVLAGGLKKSVFYL